jgi:GT2 family glycosyltransferase
MREITVVIVSWNCREYLRGCLNSLALNAGRFTADIVVVDNGSVDGTQDLVRTSYPHVRLHDSGRNLGFAAANNIALKESRGEFVLLLNPDTEVLPGALDALVQCLDQHRMAWAVGPSLLNTDRSPQRTGVRFPSLGNLVVEALFLDRLFPKTRLFGSHRALFADPHQARKVDYVQGSCLLVRREPVLQEAGLLDEGFFMYFEETDWCYRIRQSGGEVWICPDARVVHHGGGEEGHYDERRVVFYHQSLLRFTRKYFSMPARFAVRVILVVRTLLRLVVWSGVALGRRGNRRRAVTSLNGYRLVLVSCFRTGDEVATSISRKGETVRQ